MYFTVTATLRPDNSTRTDPTKDDYLPSHTPMPINLLEAFASDPELGDVRPHLSASRITKVFPAGHGTNSSVRTLQSSPRRQFRIFPALFWRIRYSRLHFGSKDVTVLASVELEVTSYADCDVSVNEVHLTLQDGEAVPFVGISGSRLPMRCRPGDLLSLLYKIKPASDYGDSSRSAQATYAVDLSVKTTAFLPGESHPSLDVRWSTRVDAALFRADVLRDSLQNRGAGDGAHAATDDLQAANTQRPSSSTTNLADFDITFTVSGPAQIYIGEIFQWNLLVVNRSDKARTLAVLVVPKRRRAEMKQHQSKHSSSSTGALRDGQEEALAEAVLDDNVVYVTQKSGYSEPAELVSLSPDIRIG